MSVQAEQFFQQLRSAVETDQLKLPTLPDVAMSIRRAVDDEQHSAQQIADIISHDPALAARLLQLANSPLYRVRGEINNLQLAVTRLGVRIVKELVTALALRQLFNTESQVLQNHFRRQWTRSVQVAAVCRLLAQEIPHLDPDQALLAGLIHNIGALPVITLAARDRDLVDNAPVLQQLTDELQNQVGALILKFWHFPDTLVRVVSNFNLSDTRVRPNPDYTDLVRTALLFADPAHSDIRSAEEQLDTALKNLGISDDSTLLSAERRKHCIDETVQSLMVI